MSKIQLTIDWLVTDDKAPVMRDTTGNLSINVAGINLTQNMDLWSKTVRPSVLVSAYPLANWWVNSWWRLHYEPFYTGIKPTHDWRMSHELGAANHGYVWPALLFSSDGEAMNIWAESLIQENQSVSYLNALHGPTACRLSDFSQALDMFIDTVIQRLIAMGHIATDLSELWSLLKEERADETLSKMRRLEARLGYDAETCPEELLQNMINFEKITGRQAMDELAPAVGREDEDKILEVVHHFNDTKGIKGTPEITPSNRVFDSRHSAPWVEGVSAAKELRALIDNAEKRITENDIYQLLGITASDVNNFNVNRSHKISIAKPLKNGALDYVSRKRHPDAKRFEFARFLGSYYMGGNEEPGWFVSSELATANQKRQRAFAAEFLCPVESLIGFLAEDFTENAIEDASEYFGVSEQTITSILQNNGFLENRRALDTPYRLVY